MPDDLRTRIAKVLTAVAEGRALYQVTNADAAVMAEAVIRELDLGIPCATNGCRMRQITKRSHRSAEKLGLIGDGKTDDE